jgi:hypothetical protein
MFLINIALKSKSLARFSERGSFFIFVHLRSLSRLSAQIFLSIRADSFSDLVQWSGENEKRPFTSERPLYLFGIEFTFIYASAAVFGITETLLRPRRPLWN